MTNPASSDPLLAAWRRTKDFLRDRLLTSGRSDVNINAVLRVMNSAFDDAALASADKEAELDAAWAAAEAALPEGWRFTVTPYWPTGWEAEAHDITRPYTPGRGKHGTGTTGPYDTPAAALLALAERLREERP